jgi:hypothetical protein
MMMAEAGTVLITDKGMLKPVEIHGRRIGFGTSRREDSLAWAEIEIYKLNDGGYMTHRAGYSLTYHTADTKCMTRNGDQKGEPATVDDLPDEAEPCQRCRPEQPEYLANDAEIRFEFPRHTFDNCEDPGQVEERLTVIHHRDHGTSVRYSKPVRDAIAEARRNDTAFRR